MASSRKTLRIMESVHSVFYTPLLATVGGGFLEREGLSASLQVVPKGRSVQDLVKAGEVDVAQSAPSNTMLALEKGDLDPPVHFASINDRDGFYIVARRPIPRFNWKMLEGATLVPASFGVQPWACLQFCLMEQGVDWKKVNLVKGLTSMDEAQQAFRRGIGDYVHLQNPQAQVLEEEGIGHIVASVGEALGPIAFSSLVATRAFLTRQRDVAEAFLRAYHQAQQWVAGSDAQTILEAIEQYFQGVDRSALVKSIDGYKRLGTWLKSPVIPERSYERAVDMMLAAGQITKRYPYAQACDATLARKVAGQAR